MIPIGARFPRPAVMGVVNVTPDSFSDGGVHLDARRCRGCCAPDGRRRRSDRRRRRRVDAARLRRGFCGRGAAARGAGAGIARGRAAGVDRHREGRGRPACARAWRELVNDVTAFRGDPAIAEVVGRARRVRLPDAHAGRAAHDAARAALRRRRGRGRGVSRGAARLRRRPRRARGPHLPRPGDRLRQDGRAQPRAACAASTSCSSSAVRS